MKEGKEDMPLVGKTMAEGHTHRMAVLCEKLGSTLREILDGTCPQPAKPEKAPKRPALEKYRETYLIPPKIKEPKPEILVCYNTDEEYFTFNRLQDEPMADTSMAEDTYIFDGVTFYIFKD